MKNLSDELLLETYYKSIELELSADFIDIIRLEIQTRKLEHKLNVNSKIS